MHTECRQMTPPTSRKIHRLKWPFQTKYEHYKKHGNFNSFNLGNHMCGSMETSIEHFALWQRKLRKPLLWRHNDHDNVSNHQHHGCLLNRLFRRRSKKTSKLRFTGLSAGNSPGTDEFPALMASDAENVSIRWRHHAWCNFGTCVNAYCNQGPLLLTSSSLGYNMDK